MKGSKTYGLRGGTKPMPCLVRRHLLSLKTELVLSPRASKAKRRRMRKVWGPGVRVRNGERDPKPFVIKSGDVEVVTERIRLSFFREPLAWWEIDR